VAAGRLERIRRRLAGRRRGAEGDQAASSDPERPEDAVGPPAEGGAGGDSGPAAPRLGELGESRREAISRRMRSVGRPGGGRLGAAAGRARACLAAAGRGVAKAGQATAEAARRLGAAVRDAWFAAPLAVRQRVSAAAALAALVALVLFVVVPIAPCWFPGGDRCPPADEAIELVPADAGAYVHANVDRDTDQYEAAAAFADRLPELTAAAVRLLPLALDRELDYDRDLRSWAGGELGVVIDTDGEEVTRMVMLETTDAEASLEFAELVLGPRVSDSEVEGVSVRTDSDGLSAAVTDGFLLIGPEPQVRESLELEPADALDADDDAGRALDALPDSRLAELYASPGFLRALAASGQLGAFETFANSAESEGLAAAVSVDEEGIDLAVRSLQDAEQAESSGDFFAALPLFDPELPERLSADALAYLGVGDPGESAATLVGRAADTAPELFAGLERFDRRLRRRDGVNLERDVLPLLEGEAALTVEPTAPEDRPESEDEEGTSLPDVPGVPYLALLAEGVEADEAAADLAALQGPIAAAVDPSRGQAPTFETREIDGVEAHSLRLSPIVNLTYAIFDDELVVGTDPEAVERLRADPDPLADSETYERVTEPFGDEVSMLLYLDFRNLLTLGERAFLSEDPGYARYATDLRTLDQAAVAVRRTDGELATDLRVTVGEPDAGVEGTEAPAVPAG
jgi:hypothetical protein